MPLAFPNDAAGTCMNYHAGGSPAPRRHPFIRRHHDHMMGGTGPYSGPARRVFTLGVGGPVGSGKTALVERLCREFWPAHDLAVVERHLHPRGRGYCRNIDPKL